MKRLPSLQKLSKLQKLDISKCPLITKVPGLGDLVDLVYLSAGKEFNSFWDKPSYKLELPDMRKLIKLRVLCLGNCRLSAVPSLDILTSLQKLVADFREVKERPSLRQVTKLETFRICGWRSKELGELDNLVMLQLLEIVHCSDVDMQAA